MTKSYAGIGSRETPTDVQCQMVRISTFLESKGYCLRSGHAPGADMAFEDGITTTENKQIFVPWPGFNGADKTAISLNPNTHNYDVLVKVAKHFHPAWNRLLQPAQKLMIRNVNQILGTTLIPDDFSQFVVCWTRDGKASGGTGQAIRIANHYNIPVYNLFNPVDVVRLGEFFRTL